jgi:hypothetical protein
VREDYSGYTKGDHAERNRDWDEVVKFAVHRLSARVVAEGSSWPRLKSDTLMVWLVYATLRSSRHVLVLMGAHRFLIWSLWL